MNRIEIFDTTLRDGAQGEFVNLSLHDKIRIAQRLDEFGIDIIEGGWPFSNEGAREFFARAAKMPWKHAQLCAFGSTRKPQTSATEDGNLLALLQAETPVVSVFGKCWDLHVTHALRVTLDQNLKMIFDSVQFLVTQGRRVIFDAEHFFDGYKANPDYAVRAIKSAVDAGADTVVLCDTNGGSLPCEVTRIVQEVATQVKAPLGIHAHNDSECAVANSLEAIAAGCTHVQGTINGLGERTGNANLCSILPALALKMGLTFHAADRLHHLTSLSHFVADVVNAPHIHSQPYVGRSAFAHKGGVHADAVMKEDKTYEHVHPESVGNTRRILVSEMAGGATVMYHAANLSLNLDKKSPEVKRVLGKVVKLENQGWSFEGAEASFELLLMHEVGRYRKLFDLQGFRVIVEKRGDNGDVITEATVKIAVDGEIMLTVAEGDGPVHALDTALRLALLRFYPDLAQIRLSDFKVRVVNVGVGTAAKVRVNVESEGFGATWSTVGVSTNIIEASWDALVQSIEYGLLHASQRAETT